MVAPARHAAQHKKRHGKHQKHTRNFLRVYSPYLPLLLLLIIILVFNTYWQSRTKHSGVLAYATSINISALLSDTNAQRASNGTAALSLNGELDQAAQAKANDMVARNYWSHNTPDGNPPWVFITQSGYNYAKAGENLAYGFATSNDTITGWMNSPPHRENLLDSQFSDVGFGFANSPDYVSSGAETLVVAMYGSPQTLGATVSTPPATQSSLKPPAQAAAPTTTPTAPLSTSQTPAPTSTPPQPTTAPNKAAFTTATPKQAEPVTQNVSRLQTLTDNASPWSSAIVTIIALAGVLILVLKNSLLLHKILRRGERYMVKHALFDATLLSALYLCFIISRTAGIIK